MDLQCDAATTANGGYSHTGSPLPHGEASAAKRVALATNQHAGADAGTAGATRDGDRARLEALYRATFERSPVAMAHTRVTGEFVRTNAAMCAMLGYTESELLSMTFRAITYPDDLAETEAHCARMLRGDISGSTFEKRYLRKDGAVVWANLSVSVAFDGAGEPEYYLCVIEDITAHKRAEVKYAAAAERERAARLLSERSAAHLHAVLDVLPVGVTIIAADGSVEEWNGAARGLWGEDLPGIQGMSDYGRYEAVRADTGLPITPEERATTRALATGAVTRDQEIIIRAHDGRTKTVLNSAGPIRNADGDIVGAVVTQVDITERKRLEREVKDRAAELSAVFDAMMEGVTVYSADGTIRHQNATALNLFAQVGVGEERTIGVPFSQRVPAYDVRDAQGRPLPRDQWPVVRVLRGETLSETNMVEATVMTPSGRELIFAYSGAPLRGPHGELAGALLVARNVTEQRQYEREREQMLSLVSHELKTPLTSVKALAQLAQRRLQQAGRPEAALVQRIERGVESMNRLINDLLDATRLDTGKMALVRERCDLRALCEQVAADQEAATARTVTVQVPEMPVVVDADETRLGQVLANLLSNALKYSASDQSVSLVLRRQRTQAHILVHDEGPGIPAEALPRLFQRFYRVPGIDVQHGTGVGLGLGLYICRRLVEMHDGQIRVESTPGQGTTFEVILPLERA